MDTTVYSILDMPIDICNIILIYAKSVVKQIYISGIGVCYELDGQIYDYHERHVKGIINNCMYNIDVDSYQTSKVIFSSETGQNCIYIDKVYDIKYANGLICEHYDAISIYDVSCSASIVSIRRTMHFNTRNRLLLYADSQYIITRPDRRDLHGVIIYNYNFDICKKIYTNSPVDYVALVSDILSYCIRGKWSPIEL